MTRAARFTKAELDRAARLSIEHGVIVKLARDGSILVFPEVHKGSSLDPSEDDILDAELAAFEASNGHG
jgi:hypothetical protein